MKVANSDCSNTVAMCLPVFIGYCMLLIFLVYMHRELKLVMEACSCMSPAFFGVHAHGRKNAKILCGCMSPVFFVYIHLYLCNFHTFNVLGNLPSGKIPSA